MSNNKTTTVNISTVAILKVILVLLVLFFLYLIRDIIAILFVSIILAAAILPAVEFFERRRLPRWIGILIVYMAAFAVISTVVYLLVPALTIQMAELSANFPRVYDKFLNVFAEFREPLQANIGQNIQELLQDWGSQLAIAAGDIVSAFMGIVGGLVTFFAVLVLTFYILMQDSGLQYLVQSVVPRAYQSYTLRLILNMQDRIALWLRGQLILSLVVGVMTYIGLAILGVKFALVLALVAAITELIPYLGPVLGAVPALFIALTQSPLLALFTLILYIIVQQLENHLLVPRIMSKVVGLNPVVVIIAILIGGKLAGIVGAIVAIPVATALGVLLREFIDSSRASAEAAEENTNKK